MSIFRKITPGRITAVLLIVWSILGIAVFRDYAVSWDEPTERGSGVISDIILKEFVSGRTIPAEIIGQWGTDRYYGLIFQHILLQAESFFISGGVNAEKFASADVWYLRHFINFFFVTAGLAALYFSAKLYNPDRKREYFPVLTVLAFMLMPRFFAESFYNVKDLVLLSGFMLAGLSLMSMMKKCDIRSVTLLAFMAAFVSAIRLTGAFFYLAGVVRILLFLRPTLLRRIGRALYFTAVFVFFLILFYPAAYSEPLTFFVDAVKTMANHPWRGHVLFMGQKYSSTQLPWYYLWVWIAVTTPTLLLTLGGIGGVSHIRYIINKCSSLRKVVFLLRTSSASSVRFQYRVMMFVLFFVGTLFFCFSAKVFYNGWRQYYFLAWPMLFLIADGAYTVWEKCCTRPVLRKCAAAAGVIFVLYIVAWNVNAHPWQQCYFNILAGNPNGRFETDYWRLSNLEAYRSIAGYSKANGRISTVRLSLTSSISQRMLSPEEARHIMVLAPEENFEFYISFEPLVFTDESKCKRVVFEEKYCPDLLFGKDVFLYTTQMLR